MKTMEPKSSEEPRKKKVAYGAAGLSLFIHLGLFLLIGSVVIVEYTVPRSLMTGEVTPVLNAEQNSSDEAPENVGEPEAMDTPSEMVAETPAAAADSPAAAVDVMTVNAPVTTFSMPASLGVPQGTGLGGQGGTEGAGAGGKPGKPGRVMANPFGGGDKSSGMLEGVLYDLKQTKDKKPSGMTPAKYFDVLKEFAAKGWNRRVLEDYYQVKNPLYSSMIYMPLMPASAAPVAFKVQSEVQPAQWIVFYQGTFQARSSGAFRLAGYADDILAVRINGKMVLDGSRTSLFEGKNSGNILAKVKGQEEMPAHKVANGFLAYSDWLSYPKDQVQSIEIVVGERPGGQFCAFLFVEEKGKKYGSEASGRPILPIFRLADQEPSGSSPAFDKDGPIFGPE